MPRTLAASGRVLRFEHQQNKFRERDFRRWVAAGETYRQIAERLGCSAKTVANLVKRLGIARPPKVKPPAKVASPGSRWEQAGFLRGVQPDAEREALEMGDRDERRANAIFARRLAEVRARRDERLGLLVIGEDDAADELERRLRREGRVA